MGHHIAVYLVQPKGLLCLPLSLSPAFTLWTCHQCPSGEILVKHKCPLFFPWGRPISKEMEIQGACWSCLVWPSSRNWWEKRASGSCILDICSCSWVQPWWGLAAGGIRLLLLPKPASGSVGITPWQCMQIRQYCTDWIKLLVENERGKEEIALLWAVLKTH